MNVKKKEQVVPQNKTGFGVYMKRYWQLYALLALPLLYLLVFKYAPMVYIQIAFKKYSIVQSVWKMPLAGNHGLLYEISVCSLSRLTRNQPFNRRTASNGVVQFR